MTGLGALGVDGAPGGKLSGTPRSGLEARCITD